MKISIARRKVRNKDMWALTASHEGKRKRKFFNTQVEAKQFDVLGWLAAESKKEPVGDKTILSVAFREYMLDYAKRNDNEHKPRQKGRSTTEDRVLKFLRWFGEDRLVSEVNTDYYMKYVNSGNWSHKTKLGYGGAVKIFMAWCGAQGYGQNKEDWYSTVNKGLKIENTKKQYTKLPGICTPSETKALLLAMPEKYRPAMAIMFFTGIRPEIEMQMLRYSDIKHGKTIRLRAERTKTGRERWIKPPANLWEWLPIKGRGHLMESYGAFNQCRRRAARRAFDFKVGTAHRKGFNYPPNGARHSFGSYGFWVSFEWALDTMGHMSSEIFLKNYKNSRVDKEEAEEYFSI